MYDILVNCPLFKGISKSEVTGLLDMVNYKTSEYKKGDIIVLSNDRVLNLFIVINGSVSGEMIDFTGKTIKIEDIESPHPLAAGFLFGSNNRYPVNIVANNEVTLLALPKSSVIRLLQANESFLGNFLDSISNRAQFLSNKIKFLSFQTIKGKISHYLLDMVNKTGADEITLSRSQTQLAELFGVTRPSLGRAIREMDRDGYIKATGRQVRILNRVGLSKLLH